jgi:small subunit ribosomal protein S17
MAKQIIGTVTSNKGDKTIVVTVHERKTHPLYKKQYTVSKKFIAHDEKNEAEPGDKVSIVETRPISARKRHSLSQIIEKPVLREDTLQATRVAGPERPATKGKAKEDGEAAVEPAEEKAK